MRGLVALRTLVGLGICAALGAIAVPAEAEPIYYARAFAQSQAGIFDSGLIQDTGQLFGADTAGPVSATRSDGAGATAFTSASVVDGTLHAFASATGSGSPSLAGGTALAQFFDTLKPTSSTLGDGTSVSFLVELDLGYSLFGSLCQDTGQVTANVTVAGAVTSLTDSTCDASDAEISAGVIQGVIGEEFVFFAELYAFASGFTGTGFADAGNSLDVFLTPLGDFSFTSASGNSYLSEESTAPVPEPASLTLLGLGLAGMAGRRWRQRKAS